MVLNDLYGPVASIETPPNRVISPADFEEHDLAPELIELRRKMDELFDLVRSRILAGETIEKIYASMGIDCTPFREGISKAPCT